MYGQVTQFAHLFWFLSKCMICFTHEVPGCRFGETHQWHKGNRQSTGILVQLRIPAIQGTHKNEDGMRETHKNKLPQSQFVWFPDHTRKWVTFRIDSHVVWTWRKDFRSTLVARWQHKIKEQMFAQWWQQRPKSLPGQSPAITRITQGQDDDSM